MRVDQLENGSPVDSWLLKAHKKFRIHIPKDENCLFKAVAEQLYPCQNYYQKVKDKCLSYLELEQNGSNFEQLQVEEKLQVLSTAYERNVTLFKKEGEDPIQVGKFGGTKANIMLRVEDGFFECIKGIEYMSTAAFCQSLLYESLYEHFGVSKEEQKEAIEKVRTKVYNNNQRNSDLAGTQNQTSYEDLDTVSTGSSSQSVPIRPPFPFRVAKSLDPSFYRNSQYDIWIDSKKAEEQKIHVGDTVLVKRPSDGSPNSLEETIGHVQTLSPDLRQAHVYDERLGTWMWYDINQLFKIVTPKKSTNSRARKQRTEQSSNPSPESGHQINPRYPGGARNLQHLPNHPGIRMPTPQLVSRNPAPTAHPQQPMTYVQPPPGVTYEQLNPIMRPYTVQPSEFTVAPQYMVPPTQLSHQQYLQPPQYPVFPPGQLFYPPNYPQENYGLGVPQAVPPPVQQFILPLTIPYNGTYGPVNNRIQFSQDRHGNDLPMNDVDTLRFYFNVGLACAGCQQSYSANPSTNPPNAAQPTTSFLSPLQ